MKSVNRAVMKKKEGQSEKEFVNFRKKKIPTKIPKVRSVKISHATMNTYLNSFLTRLEKIKKTIVKWRRFFFLNRWADSATTFSESNPKNSFENERENVPNITE